jgi:hypothetical protein
MSVYWLFSVHFVARGRMLDVNTSGVVTLQAYVGCGSHSGVSEDSGPLGYDAVSLG